MINFPLVGKRDTGLIPYGELPGEKNHFYGY